MPLSVAEPQCSVAACPLHQGFPHGAYSFAICATRIGGLWVISFDLAGASD